MAVIKRGILGGFQGTVANVVGSTWKGIDVMKSKPLSVANPKTSAQQSQRGKFAQSVAFAKVILVSIIKPLWDRFAQRESGYNAWISNNIDNFDSNGLSTPADLAISQGSLEGGSNVAAVIAGPLLVNISFDDNSADGNASATDTAYGVVFDNTTGEILGQTAAGTTRDASPLGVAVPADPTGNDLYCYLAFRRADGTLVSNTSAVQIAPG